MLLLGLLLSLAAGSGEDVVVPGYRAKGAPSRACTAAHVTAPGFPKLRQKFSARKILDLQFEARGSRRVEGPHVLHFKVFTPRGHLYQDIAVPFSVDPASATRTGQAKPSRNPIRARLPVAGTSIANNSLYGRWRVVPYLDDSIRPCAAATTFRIVR
jgi:hypothetical protein